MQYIIFAIYVIIIQIILNVILCYFCFRCCVVFNCDDIHSSISTDPKDSGVCEKLIDYEYNSYETCESAKYKITCCPKSK